MKDLCGFYYMSVRRTKETGHCNLSIVLASEGLARAYLISEGLTEDVACQAENGRG